MYRYFYYIILSLHQIICWKLELLSHSLERASNSENTEILSEISQIEVLKTGEEVQPKEDVDIVEKETISENVELLVRVKMIDFAHVLKSNGKEDEGYVKGLQNIISFLENFM